MGGATNPFFDACQETCMTWPHPEVSLIFSHFIQKIVRIIFREIRCCVFLICELRGLWGSECLGRESQIRGQVLCPVMLIPQLELLFG